MVVCNKPDLYLNEPIIVDGLNSVIGSNMKKRLPSNIVSTRSLGQAAASTNMNIPEWE